MRPAPPSIRPCSPMLRAPQKVCVGGFFLVKAHTPRTHGKFVLVFVFPPAVGRVAVGQKNNPTPEGVRLLSFGLLFGCC
jgi:hypothetical protein